MMPNIMQKFAIDARHFGRFSGFYYFGYALMHIPLGLLLDRLQIKWILGVSLFLSVLGMMPLYTDWSWSWVLAGRFLVGASSSAAILSVFKVTRTYFPEQWFSRLLGVSVMLGVLGALYGSNPVDRLSQALGWEKVLLVFFGAGSLTALLVVAFTPKQTISKAIERESPWKELRAVAGHKTVVLTALFGACMVGPLEGFADVWATAFLKQVYSFDRDTATQLPPLIFIGMSLGSPILAAISERFNIYYGIVMASALAMMALFGTLMFVPLNAKEVGVLFFGLGLFSAYQVLVVCMNSQNVPKRYIGLVGAFTNMTIMSFGMLFHIAITQTMNWFWDGLVVNGVPFYSPQCYVWGLSVIPAALALGFVGFVYLGAQSKGGSS
jgi:predicted MFS family arabinose efflux permease